MKNFIFIPPVADQTIRTIILILEDGIFLVKYMFTLYQTEIRAVFPSDLNRTELECGINFQQSGERRDRV
jgi:hypothetical protein